MMEAAWEAMDAAIPRIQADERYGNYLVAIAASPHAGKEGAKLANSWFETATNGIHFVAQSATNGVRQVSRMAERSIAETFDHLRGVFGPYIRD